jgi:type I restriction enzyme M protein
MDNHTQQIVNKAWSYAHVLRDAGLPFHSYTQQITFLLFLKMADERTKPPYNRPPIVPLELGWQSLLERDGQDLELHYRHVLEELGKGRASWPRSSSEPASRYRTPPSSGAS